MKTLFSIAVFAVALSGMSFAGQPVNDVCPVCGKAGRLIFRSEYNGQHVIFHTADCKDKFDKNPGKYKITPKKD